MSGAATDVAWVVLGSNIGNRGRALARLRELLAGDGVAIEALSTEVLTRPVGVTGQADFHNQVVKLRALQPWTPERWLDHARRAEAGAGRKPTYHWGPRRADVDILMLGEIGDVHVDSPDLTVPHPQLHNRQFITRLLAELGFPLNKPAA